MPYVPKQARGCRRDGDLPISESMPTDRTAMPRKMLRLLRRVFVLVLVVAGTLLAVRAWDSQRGAPLDPWHTHVPHDWHAGDIDKADWAAYLKAEEATFREVRT